MSSLIRRLQIRAIRKRGYLRASFELVPDGKGGVAQKPVRHGGIILDPNNEPIGYQWPRWLARSEPEPKREPQKAKRRPQKRLAVPAHPVRSTRKQRAEQHRAKMVAKGHRTA